MSVDAGDPARWEKVGLTQEEYRELVEGLGREPNPLELEMAGVMWSEHCSYKSSKVHLRRFPSRGPQVLLGPGENAGVLDLGDGVALALRCESHNHPTAVEPYQGAATGVGGILRDIMAVGARPFALLNSLRFGPITSPRTRYLLRGAVSGIGGYGNCVGVPTVGGEVRFAEGYRENPLVNVMCLGLVPRDRIVRGRAEGVGNPIFLIGARTGRDGIHGASLLASRELEDGISGGEEARPAVQVGDPFLGKLLLEATLALIEAGVVTGVNDLGAAGLTSALSETATRAGNGVNVDVSRVLRREPDLAPDEVMLSESQERMLAVVRAGHEEEALRILARWGLEAAEIGRVCDDGMLTVRDGEKVLARMPADLLTERAPSYRRPSRPPEDLQGRWRFHKPSSPPQGDVSAWTELLGRMLAAPNLASKRWVYEQYDTQVRGQTVLGPGADAAVVRIPGTRRAVAAAVDGNGRVAGLDPYRGGALAVAEAARNVACVGARPLGLTNCLNFASPERPEVMWQFEQVIAGMADAAAALQTPVTGGNVSFYNETPTSAVDPTPVVGMVGLLEDVERVLRPGWDRPGDRILLLGEPVGVLAAGEYLDAIHGITAGRPPAVDLERERRLIELLLAAHREGLLRAAHDISEGGTAVALAECAFAAAATCRGARIRLPRSGEGDWAEILFGEGSARALVVVAPEHVADMGKWAEAVGFPPPIDLGETGGDRLCIEIGEMRAIDAPVDELRRRWLEAIPSWMD